MLGWIFMLLALVFSGAAHSESNDFAYGRLISADETSAVQRLTVPEDVYLRVTRDDLGDLRVLNDDGSEVPYALRRPQDSREFSQWQTLPVFTLPASESGSAGGARVNVQVDGEGAVVAVSGSVGGSVSGHAEDFAHLLDLSRVTRNLSQLKVVWENADDFIAGFRVDASDDLNYWRRIVGSVTLASLTTEGERVLLDQIELPATTAPYLKITQVDGSERIGFAEVTGRSRQSHLPERHWRQLSGEESDGGYDFSIEGRFPADRIRVALNEDNYLLRVRLFSRSSAQGMAWRNRGEHTFYRTQVDGVTVTSEPAGLKVTDRFWRVELPADTAGTPEMEIGWLPDEVVFLKQDSAPLLLVYGQADIQGHQWPMQDLLSRLDNERDFDSIPAVSVGVATELGGAARLIPSAAPIDWQTILLWIVLVAGVGIVGFFAARLLREK
jgi:hypothetical protein